MIQKLIIACVLFVFVTAGGVGQFWLQDKNLQAKWKAAHDEALQCCQAKDSVTGESKNSLEMCSAWFDALKAAKRGDPTHACVLYRALIQSRTEIGPTSTSVLEQACKK